MELLHTSLSLLLRAQREGGVPLLSLSNQKDVTLEVKVTNPGGDDAYEASVLATFPNSLTYSTYRVPPDVSPPPLHPSPFT